MIQAMTPNGWWTTPYRFTTTKEAFAFMDKLVAANPGRQFRVI